MSMSQLNAAEGPPDSAVQNRLTAAAAVLATLFFGGSFAMQLHAQSRTGRTFAESFAYLEVTIVVGALLAFVSIACLLLCQHCVATDRGWAQSKRGWFIVANTAQYLSIAQGMSAGLTELVFGIKHTFDAAGLALVLALSATLVWWLLLFVAPLHALRRWWPHLARGERALVSVSYGLMLAFVLLSNGTIYLIQDGAPDTLGSLAQAVGRQLVQPMTWLDTWAHPPRATP
ncbi:hypothetical protein [Paenacidovorax caeni]|nr:hypothetical protein [Paenacidovorax caeni]